LFVIGNGVIFLSANGTVHFESTDTDKRCVMSNLYVILLFPIYTRDKSIYRENRERGYL